MVRTCYRLKNRFCLESNSIRFYIREKAIFAKKTRARKAFKLLSLVANKTYILCLSLAGFKLFGRSYVDSYILQFLFVASDKNILITEIIADNTVVLLSLNQKHFQLL